MRFHCPSNRAFVYIWTLVIHLWLPSAASVSLPLSVSSRWIVDASEARVKLACVSWAAHLEPVVAEGLDKQPLSTITGLISSSGFNCVRLTYATYMFTRHEQGGQTVLDSLNSWGLSEAANGITVHNPSLAYLSVVEAYKKVVEAIAAKNLLIILDNHISKPGWCCSDNDGNGFWWDRDFDPDEWLRGLETVADLALDYPNVVALGLRNEPRGPRQNAADWRKYMAEGADRIHGANPNVLLFMSGLSYASDLTFLLREPLAFENRFLRNKLVYEVHWYSWSSGAYYSNSNLDTVCASDVKRFMDGTGFVLTPNQEYTSPLVVSEFGYFMDGKSPGDNRFMDCYFALASKLDLDWILWTLQGSYYRKDGQTDYEELYGLVTKSWNGIRNATFLQRLRGLQYQLPGPVSGDGISYRALFHPATGLCVFANSDSSLSLYPCQSSSSIWGYDTSEGLMIKLKGSISVVIATANGNPAKLDNGMSCSACHWTLAGDTGLQFAVDVGGKKLCLDGKSGSVITTVDCLCVNRWECGGSQLVPTKPSLQICPEPVPYPSMAAQYAIEKCCLFLIGVPFCSLFSSRISQHRTAKALEKAEEAEEEDAFMRESFLALSTNPDWKLLESSSAFVEGATVTHSSKTTPGPRPTEIGCPHCGQRFETKQGLKSHMKTRHAKLLQATKTWFKKQRRRNGSGNHSGKTGTARALAPTKQDFSVYD